MNTSKKGNQLTRKEWEELGFFYDIRDDEKLWYIAGSKQGLNNFYNILTDFINDPQNNRISSHEHYGPYMYLKIMTMDQPDINSDAIQGNKKDLKRLAEIFKTKLNDASIGDHFIIGKEYTLNNDYSIFVEIMEEGFNPASIDPELEKEMVGKDRGQR